MRHGQRAERHRRRQSVKGVAMLLASVAFFGLLGAAYLLWPKPICERPATVAYAVLFDVTSDLSAAQRLDIKNKVIKTVRQMPAGARLQFWQVTPVGSDVPKAMDAPICKPPAEPNQWIENVKEAEKKAAEFEQNVQRLADAAIAAGESQTSPILQAIQAIWLRLMDAPDFTLVKEKHLVIVSDLVQNTPGLSFYKDVDFQRLKSGDAYQKLRTNLSGAKVSILLLKHAEGVSTAPLIRLWEQIVADMQAEIELVERITG